jgi:hypothetical protein
VVANPNVIFRLCYVRTNTNLPTITSCPRAHPTPTPTHTRAHEHTRRTHTRARTHTPSCGCDERSHTSRDPQCHPKSRSTLVASLKCCLPPRARGCSPDSVASCAVGRASQALIEENREAVARAAAVHPFTAALRGRVPPPLTATPTPPASVHHTVKTVRAGLLLLLACASQAVDLSSCWHTSNLFASCVTGVVQLSVSHLGVWPST